MGVRIPPRVLVQQSGARLDPSPTPDLPGPSIAGAPGAALPPRRRTGRFRRFLGFLGILVLAVAALSPWWSVVAVSYLLRRSLESSGFGRAQFVVESVGIGHATLREALLDPAIPVRAGRVEALFTPSGLWRGKIDEIKLIGVEAEIAQRKGEWDLGQWPTMATRGAGSDAENLPVGLIVVEHSTVTVDLEGSRFVIPFDASVSQGADKSFALRGSAAVHGYPVLFDARISREPEMLIDIALSAAKLHEQGIAIEAFEDEGIGARPLVQALATRTGDGWSLEGTIQPARVTVAGATPFSATVESISANFTLNDGNENLWSRVEGGLRAEVNELDIDGRALGHTTMDLRLVDDAGGSATQTFIAGTASVENEIGTVELRDVWIGPFMPLMDGGEWHGSMIAAVHSLSPRMETQATITATIRPTSDGREIEARVNTTGIDATGTTWEIKAPSAGFMMDGRVEEGRFAANGLLEFAGASVDADIGESIALREVSANIPFRFGSADDAVSADGPLTIEGLSIGGVDLPGIVGRVEVHDQEASLALDWTPWTSNPLSVSGTLKLVDGWPEGFLDVHLAPSTLAVSSLPEGIRSLIGGLGQANVRLEGGVHIVEGRLLPDLELQIDRGTWNNDELAARLEGVSLSARLVEAWPPRTAGPARLRIASAMVGTTPINDAEINFGLEGELIRVESMRWSMGPLGRFRASTFRLDPSDPRIETDLDVEQADLKTWFAFVAPETLAGEGRFYGHVSGSFDPKAVQPLVLTGGYLYATPDGGWIQIRDRTIAEQAVAGIALTGPSPDAVADLRRRVTDAVSDFSFDVLRGDLVPGSDGMTLEVFSRGKGRNQTPAVPIGGITFLLREYDQMMYDLFRLKMSTNRSLNDSLRKILGDRP